MLFVYMAWEILWFRAMCLIQYTFALCVYGLGNTLVSCYVSHSIHIWSRDMFETLRFDVCTYSPHWTPVNIEMESQCAINFLKNYLNT